MILYTARVDYGGADRLDVTRKSGKGVGLLLAPSWSILLPVISARRAGKETQESWEAYEQAYATWATCEPPPREESPYKPLQIKRRAEYRPLVSMTGSKP
jgi:hypothetical protein